MIAAIGGGGLITGVGSAIKALRPDVKVFGAEPETAAPYALSRREGRAVDIPDWEASFVDGAGGQSITQRMWERMLAARRRRDHRRRSSRPRQAMRLLAEKARVIAEGAGALSPAAALTGEAGRGADRLRHLGRQYRSGEIRAALVRRQPPERQLLPGEVWASASP